MVRSGTTKKIDHITKQAIYPVYFIIMILSYMSECRL